MAYSIKMTWEDEDSPVDGKAEFFIQTDSGVAEAVSRAIDYVNAHLLGDFKTKNINAITMHGVTFNIWYSPDDCFVDDDEESPIINLFLWHNDDY